MWSYDILLCLWSHHLVMEIWVPTAVITWGLPVHFYQVGRFNFGFLTCECFSWFFYTVADILGLCLISLLLCAWLGSWSPYWSTPYCYYLLNIKHKMASAYLFSELNPQWAQCMCLLRVGSLGKRNKQMLLNVYNHEGGKITIV